VTKTAVNENYPCFDDGFYREYAEPIFEEIGLPAYDYVVDFFKNNYPSLLPQNLERKNWKWENHNPDTNVYDVTGLWNAVAVASAYIEHSEENELIFDHIGAQAAIRRELNLPYEIIKTGESEKNAPDDPEIFDLEESIEALIKTFGGDSFKKAIDASCSFLKSRDNQKRQVLERLKGQKKDFEVIQGHYSQDQLSSLITALQGVCERIEYHEKLLKENREDPSWEYFLTQLFKVRKLNSVS
jgi:hypothetical protein